MPLTLIPETGAGLPNANTLATRDQVTTALEASPFADAWADVDPTKQDQCIVEASAWLTRLGWEGMRTTEAQAMAWPRAWMTTPDGYAIASNLVPTFVVEAVARLAFWLSQQGASPYESNGLQPGTELALPGGLRLTPDSGVKLPADVLAILRPYLSASGAVVWG
jgi:hypothetical protein